LAVANQLEGNLAGAEENVLISAGDCTLTLLPALGGKIASLRVGHHELLQAPLQPLAPRTTTVPFAESDASGWDECLPSVAPCTIQTEAGPATIPDHGDLWRVPWQLLQSNQDAGHDASRDSATLRATCFSLPLQLTRSMILSESATGWRLQFLYSLTSLAAYPVPWSWSAHPLFAVDPGDRVILPGEIRTLRLEGSRCDCLGAPGDAVRWPVASAKDRREMNLAVVPSHDARIGDKLFAGPFQSSQQSWCSLERARLGLRLTLRFEPEFTPYLGLWLCYGGWPEGPGEKQYCVAPEPATAPTDSLASTGPWSRSLEPGETVNWPMELLIDRIP
jgi:galactose mutarotase-like enzyme